MVKYIAHSKNMKYFKKLENLNKTQFCLICDSFGNTNYSRSRIIKAKLINMVDFINCFHYLVVYFYNNDQVLKFFAEPTQLFGRTDISSIAGSLLFLLYSTTSKR